MLWETKRLHEKQTFKHREQHDHHVLLELHELPEQLQLFWVLQGTHRTGMKRQFLYKRAFGKMQLRDAQQLEYRQRMATEAKQPK
jgi:hypothetical protein